MLAITIPKVMSFSGDLKLLDMIPFGYDIDYVNTLMAALGKKGRQAYLFNQIPLDMFYPGLFGITYCIIFAYFLKQIGKFESKLYYICLLPLFAGLFDYFENFGIITILSTYPANLDFLSQTTSVFSILKASTTTIYYFFLIIILVVFGIKKLRGRR